MLASSVSVLDVVIERNRVPSVTYFHGDITSSSDARRVCQEVKPEVIIHTVSPVVASHSEKLYHKVNVIGTKTLVETAGQLGYTRAFIYTSTSSVISDGSSDLLSADEQLPILYGSAQPSLYASSKANAEQYVLAVNRQYNDMMTCAIRPCMLFGPGDTQLLLQMLSTYEQGKTKLQLGDNKNLFDFTYVENAAHAHILAAQKLLDSSTQSPSAAKVDGEAFLITNDEPYRFWDFTHAIWAAAGDETKPEEIWIIPVLVGLFLAEMIQWLVWIVSFGTKEPSLTSGKIRFSAMTRTFCIDKAKSRLEYGPIVGMRESIEKSVNWYKEVHLEAKKTQ